MPQALERRRHGQLLVVVIVPLLADWSRAHCLLSLFLEHRLPVHVVVCFRVQSPLREGLRMLGHQFVLGDVWLVRERRWLISPLDGCYSYNLFLDHWIARLVFHFVNRRQVVV